jgi:hypothetical protein
MLLQGRARLSAVADPIVIDPSLGAPVTVYEEEYGLFPGQGVPGPPGPQGPAGGFGPVLVAQGAAGTLGAAAGSVVTVSAVAPTGAQVLGGGGEHILGDAAGMSIRASAPVPVGGQAPTGWQVTFARTAMAPLDAEVLAYCVYATPVATP